MPTISEWRAGKSADQGLAIASGIHPWARFVLGIDARLKALRVRRGSHWRGTGSFPWVSSAWVYMGFPASRAGAM